MRGYRRVRDGDTLCWPTPESSDDRVAASRDQGRCLGWAGRALGVLAKLGIAPACLAEDQGFKSPIPRYLVEPPKQKTPVMSRGFVFQELSNGAS